MANSQFISTAHADNIHDCQFDYYGKHIATCSSDRTVKILRVLPEGDSLVADLLGHEGPVWQVSWSHPRFGSLLASCSYDKKVVLWKEVSENNWQKFKEFIEHEASVNSISFAPHEVGLYLACGSSDGTISIISVNPKTSQWEVEKIHDAHRPGVTSVSWAPFNYSSGGEPALPRLASGGCDNTMKIWKKSEGSWKLDCFPALEHDDWVRDVKWAPNLGLPKITIASASQDKTVKIWTQEREGAPWESHVLKVFPSPVWSLSWSLSGNFLAVADSISDPSVWKEVGKNNWVETIVPQ